MRETPAEYTKRILKYSRNGDALRIQQSTLQKIERAIKGLRRKQMMTRPAPGKWSIGEILAHLAEAELTGGYRLRLILSANGTVIQAFDQDVWAKNSDYAHQDPRQSLEMFRVLREANLRLLKTIPKRMWLYYGMHQERGKETIDRVARMFAGHDVNHIEQIVSIARGLGH
jgi:uncharacterized damage-inducible protein DinB